MASISSIAMESIPSPDVFISYRHADTREMVDRMYDYLRKELGEERVFRDVESIGQGEVIRERVAAALRSCKVLLVVIGKAWAGPQQGDRPSRLFDPDDYVRYEITTAMGTAFQIIPVTVHDAPLPDHAQLPAELAKAMDRLAISVRGNPYFVGDMDLLVKRLKDVLLDCFVQRRTAPSAAATVRIHGHSNFFYWWPVWVMGFLMALVTWWGNDRLAVVPADIAAVPRKKDERQVMMTAKANATSSLQLAEKQAGAGEVLFPNRIADNGWAGYLFAMTLLGIVAFTTIRLEELWSIVAILLFLIVLIILALIDDTFRALGIHMSLGALLFLSTSLLIMWLVVVFGFDRQFHIDFTPREIIVCPAFGDKVLKFSVFNMVVARQPMSDLRHWVLRSGDLTVRLAGADGREFVFYNVSFVRAKLKALQELYQDGPVKILE